MKPGMPAIILRAPPLSNSEPNATSALPKVSSPESVCIGDHEPPLGVPSISRRAPSRAIMRCQVSGFSSCIVRATRPPIECAIMRTGCWLVVARRERGVDRRRRGGALRPRSGGASRRRTGSPRACRPGARSGRRRRCRSARRARRCAAVAGSQASFFRPLTKRKPSQMRLPSSFRLEPRMPGSTNTAGRSAASAPGPPRERATAFAARVPLASSPAHDSGPMAAKSAGAASSSALAIALHGAVVGEVVEVRDLRRRGRAGSARRCRRARLARRAAVHRARLHDEVVVGPVEGVGQQRLDPRADRVALHVAGDHAQLARESSRLCRCSQVTTALSGIIASMPGSSAGSARRRATSCRKSTSCGADRDARQLQPPLQHRQVGVEALRREQRAARRAGRRAPCARPSGPCAAPSLTSACRSVRCVGVLVAGEQRQLVAAERPAAARARQHLGDEAAARVRDEVQRARPPASRAPAPARWRSGSRPASGGRARRRDPP